VDLLLSVDPGLRGCGCALWAGARLTRAGYVTSGSKDKRSSAWLAMSHAVRDWVGGTWPDALAVELPQVYRESLLKGDPNDLVDLACVVGGLCEIFSGAKQRVYLPKEWKGHVPKEIHHARAKKRLDAAELAGVELPSQKGLAHNVWDGVALGLTDLGRL
jgi:hypothetical protein